jgi:hypothetical protein
MSQSKRFYQLRKRLSELRRHMLPSKFSPTGSYSPREEDRARGYRLLTHAEIESYLEDQARSVVTDRIRVWKNSRTPSNLLLAFLACYHSGWFDYDEENNIRIIELSKSRKRIKEAVSEIVDQAQTQFIQNLQGNHGVREKNLKMLILPTGVDLRELDATWIADLDDFGKQRGEIAHNAKMTTGGINPEDEYNRVKSLLIGLKELDKKLIQVL